MKIQSRGSWLTRFSASETAAEFLPPALAETEPPRRAAAVQERPATRPGTANAEASTRFRDLLLRSAQADPGAATRLCRIFALDASYEKSGPLLDISAYPTVRFAHTGEVVTESNLAAFKAEATKVTQGRIALYESEKAQGTPDVVILDKLFDYTDTQSDAYLSKIGWTRPPTP